MLTKNVISFFQIAKLITKQTRMGLKRKIMISLCCFFFKLLAAFFLLSNINYYYFTLFKEKKLNF